MVNANTGFWLISQLLFLAVKLSRITTRFRKAPVSGAFFIALFLLLVEPVQASNTHCPSFLATESATVQYVHDGDTLILKDRRKVRLIGIDTPELARKKNNTQLAAQPFSAEARDLVRQLIQKHGATVRLMAGKEPQDRYGRYLYHVQLANGSLIQSQLLEHGLAIAFTTSPNTTLSHCYQQQEKLAREMRRGFWPHSKYQLKHVSQLNTDSTGFHRVKGLVRHVGESRKAWWLNFDNDFSVRIDKRDLIWFDLEPQALQGKTLLVRGWIRRFKDKLQMSLRHPDAIEQP